MRPFEILVELGNVRADTIRGSASRLRIIWLYG